MNKTLLTLCLFTLPLSPALAQVSPDVGAGVVKFLLGNPKRADRMNTDQRLALDILGELLTTQGERQHALKYAAAGAGQITINTGSGSEARLVRDASGKVFMLLENVIYPISTELVSQALGTDATSSRSPEPLVNTLDLSKIQKSFGRWGYWGFREVFAFKWRRDVVGDGWGFEDFHGIGNAFYDTDDFGLSAVLEPRDKKAPARWELEVVDARSGESIQTFSDVWSPPKDLSYWVITIDVKAGTLRPGNYIVYAKSYGPKGGMYNPSTMQLTIVKGETAQSSERRETAPAPTEVREVPVPDLTAGVSVVAPTNPATLYRVQAGGGVLKSIDGGSTWGHVAPAHFRISAIAVSPRDENTVLVALDQPPGSPSVSGLWMTREGGRTWTMVLAHLNASAIAVRFDPIDPDVIWATLRDEQTGTSYNFRSRDGASTWTLITNPQLPTAHR